MKTEKSIFNGNHLGHQGPPVCSMRKIRAKALTLLRLVCLAIGVSGVAHAQSSDVCGPLPAPVLQPVLASPNFKPSESAVDCFMWQTFIYLNWPALEGRRGIPDTKAHFDDRGPTVWETYKSYDAVFLPNALAPQGWNDDLERRQKLLNVGVKDPGPALRMLSSVSKIFRKILGGKSENLDDIHQVDGGILYDQAGTPVFYEMMLNEPEFNYIVNNRLYDADEQYRFAQKSAIVLPAGSIEIKAAWKVLTKEEARAKPLRFHTVRAVVPGSIKPVTVGLVGLHIYQVPSASNFNQGFWATFQHVDNAPQPGSVRQAAYSFNNPRCNESKCPPNTPFAPGAPTQVMQTIGSAPAVRAVNAYFARLIKARFPDSPWQFYEMIGVQWPTSPRSFDRPAWTEMLPEGTPNSMTMVNPVMETFIQRDGISCLNCHAASSVAVPRSVPNRLPYATSYSFLFGHAHSREAVANK
jgi:hypothetical protein